MYMNHTLFFVDRWTTTISRWTTSPEAECTDQRIGPVSTDIFHNQKLNKN